MDTLSEKLQLLRPTYPPTHNNENNYLLGLRGWFVIQSFLYVFMVAFLPGAVEASANTQGPSWQINLKKSLSVLFWNSNLIYSFFILLSARCIAIPFLHDPSKTSLTRAIFQRGLRLWFPTAFGLAIAKLILATTNGIEFIDYFKQLTGNTSIGTPYNIPNALAYFNSVFNMFWITRDFATSAGSLAFPSQLLWIITVIYTQSYTIFMTMLIIPYTRSSWRVKASIFFIITAWWVQSWAWYSITGLILADMVINMDFKTKSQRGIPFYACRGWYCPIWVIHIALMGAGLLMQFIWTGWKPQKVSAEIEAHAGLYYTGGLNKRYDLSQPQARDDIYLILLGLFGVVETYDWIQWVLSNRVFVYLGTRSLSWLFAQGIVIYTAGMRLFVHLNVKKGWGSEVSVFVSFLVCLATVIPFAELFHRLIDYPSRAMSYRLFYWIRE